MVCFGGQNLSSLKDAKTSWIEEGLRILETKGPAILSIDTLALRTGKTKGSFYHHFYGREDYIARLLEHYEKTATIEVIQLSSDAVTPRERLAALTTLTFQLSSRLELAIRAWALNDPLVRRFQDRMDRRRLSYLEELHTAGGMAPDAVRTRSYRDYALFLGLQQLSHHHAESEFRSLIKRLFTDI